MTILHWFEEYGRELPWRGTHDPYAIWLSEVILQQTRISQGTEYWHRFMQRWPTVEELAAASEDEVLKEWQGLGYYSRARNLHHAAQQIFQQGQFPHTYKEIRALKGVGDYTAAAISSIPAGRQRLTPPNFMKKAAACSRVRAGICIPTETVHLIPSRKASRIYTCTR